MSLSEKQSGDQLSAQDDWNPVVRAINALESSTRKYANRIDPRPLYGEAAGVIPKWSLVEVYDKALSITREEVPIVGVRTPTSDAPLCMATTGDFPTIANKPTPIQLIMVGDFVKLEVDAADVPGVGTECGPQSGSNYLSPDGVGFICLTAPVTYETSKKYVWAAATNNAQTGAIIDIRISGLNYQYTKNGVDWTTWATATEDCEAP